MAALQTWQPTMIELSRREFLEALAAAYAAAVMGCKRTGDPFAREHVCIHIFDPAGSIPPLLERTAFPSVRDATEEYFEIGLPEVLVCTTRTKFLDMFQYFWPFSQSDFAQLQESIEIGYERQIIRGAADLDDLATYLRSHKAEAIRPSESSAVVFTYNDFTRHWTSDVITACRDARIAEFVLFKDPTLSPYLCTYPAKQKGFKRPPP